MAITIGKDDRKWLVRSHGTYGSYRAGVLFLEFL